MTNNRPLGDWEQNLLAEKFVVWLNKSRHTRIEKLLAGIALLNHWTERRSVEGAVALLEIARTYQPKRLANMPTPPLAARNVAFVVKVVRDVGRELNRHRMKPRLLAVGKKLEFSWDSGGSEAGSAVQAIMSLGTAGELWRIRQCRTCPKWFVASKQDNWSCSTTCRKKHYNATDKAKKLNRKRVKAYYDRNYRG